MPKKDKCYAVDNIDNVSDDADDDDYYSDDIQVHYTHQNIKISKHQNLQR